ncbi:hypothetical protein GCM10027300_24070 [Modestobacter lapidis]
MTAGEKLEQHLTARPSSYVPARTLTALTTGRRLPESARPPVRNHLMHWGTGATLGALRGIWSAAGLRGWRASAWHASVRLATDQTLENATGVGSPPWTWSRQDLVVDLLHKAVYSLATGLVADRLIPPERSSRVTPGADVARGTGGLWD